MHTSEIKIWDRNPLRQSTYITLDKGDENQKFSTYPLCFNTTSGCNIHKNITTISDCNIGYCMAYNHDEYIVLPCIHVEFELKNGEKITETFVASQLLPKLGNSGECLELRSHPEAFDSLLQNALTKYDLVFILSKEELLPYGFTFVNNLELLDEDELNEFF